MEKINSLIVQYDKRVVGTLAVYQRQFVVFEYHEQWIEQGFSISPFSLPLRKQVFIPKVDPFDGLFGVFADSLPDGWGRLLVDRFMLAKGMNPREVGNLQRLAIVGDSGMGALSYEPNVEFAVSKNSLDLDGYAEECSRILNAEHVENLDDLFLYGGSSGGARPKILTKVSGEDWIIKFPSSQDDSNIGEREFLYSRCARECGIEMAETKLFDSKKCAGYFGTKRFDRYVDSGGHAKRRHMVSVSALLETSHRIPNLDYEILMKLTLQITNDFAEVEKMFRLMCFNVYAHNRDDHSKNFSYIYEEENKRWLLSPAYDLTYSYSIGGEHATTIHGNGKNPGIDDILAVADIIGMKRGYANNIAKNIAECCREFDIYYGGEGNG